MSRRTAVCSVLAGAVALGGVALLVPTGASAAATGSALVQQADAAAQGGHARLLTPAQRTQLRTTGHLSLTKKTKKHGTVTVLVQRGDVTAMSPTSISLKSKDGFSHSYAITDRTKVKERGQTVDLADEKVGERAMVVALQTAKGDVARRISCVRPGPASATPGGPAAPASPTA